MRDAEPSEVTIHVGKEHSNANHREPEYAVELEKQALMV
jgi:hypothetical protein